jgi:hypothetical protein
MDGPMCVERVRWGPGDGDREGDLAGRVVPHLSLISFVLGERIEIDLPGSTGTGTSNRRSRRCSIIPLP